MKMHAVTKNNIVLSARCHSTKIYELSNFTTPKWFRQYPKSERCAHCEKELRLLEKRNNRNFEWNEENA